MNSNDVAAIDAARADVGIVCSLPIEIAEFLGRCKRLKTYSGGQFKFVGGFCGDIRIAIVEAGMGPTRASRATHALLDAHQPRWIVSTGFAGALNTDMKRGHIVVANEVVGLQGDPLRIDLGMESDLHRGLHVGRTLTVDKMVRTIEDKRALAAQSGAIAVDMETLAVATVCRQTKTRFMAVRVISDDLSADLPPEILSLVGDTGAIRLGAVIGSLWKRPSSIKDMWRMREHAMDASEKLASFLVGTVTQLHSATT
ncbi:MAG: mtnN [Schlesneria sp.]|nr:mtnN [Schlesneria sp.]